MAELELEHCEVCGNHAVATLRADGDLYKECEVCGNLSGPADVIDLVELQREADGLGVSIHSFPLAQFIDSLPGLKLQGDSGGDREKGRLPFVAFEATDHRTYQLENLGQALRLLRAELQCQWCIEFTFEYELGFELKPRAAAAIDARQVETARADMIKLWRKLQSFKGLAWWKQ